MSVEVCRLRAFAASACGLRRPPSSAIAATPLENIPARPSAAAAHLLGCGHALLEPWLQEPIVGVALKRQGLEANDIISACAKCTDSQAASAVETRHARQLLAQLAWEVELCSRTEMLVWSGGAASTGVAVHVAAVDVHAAQADVDNAAVMKGGCTEGTCSGHDVACRSSLSSATPSLLAMMETIPGSGGNEGPPCPSYSSTLLLAQQRDGLSEEHREGAGVGQMLPGKTGRGRSPTAPSSSAERWQASLERARLHAQEQQAKAELSWEKKARCMEGMVEHRSKRIEEMRRRIRERSKKKQEQLAHFHLAEKQKQEAKEVEVFEHALRAKAQVAECERRQQEFQDKMEQAAATRIAAWEQKRHELLQKEEAKREAKTRELSKALAEASVRREEGLRMKSAGPPELRAVRELAHRQAMRVERIRAETREQIREAYEWKMRNGRSPSRSASRITTPQTSRPSSASLWRGRKLVYGNGPTAQAATRDEATPPPHGISTARRESDKLQTFVHGSGGELEESEAGCAAVSTLQSPERALTGRHGQFRPTRPVPEASSVPWPGLASNDREWCSSYSTPSHKVAAVGSGHPGSSTQRFPQQQASAEGRSKGRPTSAGKAGRSVGAVKPPANGIARPVGTGISVDVQGDCSNAGSGGRGEVGRIWEEVFQDMLGIPSSRSAPSEDGSMLLDDFAGRSALDSAKSFASLLKWAKSDE